MIGDSAVGQAGPADEVAAEEPKFVPFRGTGQRLDGKPAASPSVPLPAPGAPPPTVVGVAFDLF